MKKLSCLLSAIALVSTLAPIANASPLSSRGAGVKPQTRMMPGSKAKKSLAPNMAVPQIPRVEKVARARKAGKVHTVRKTKVTAAGKAKRSSRRQHVAKTPATIG